MSNSPRYRRPAYSDPAVFDRREGGADPADISQAAHDTAHALITQGRDAADPDITERFVRLAETEGIEAIAELWAHSPSRSLAGSLWRIYALRAAVHKNPQRMSEYYRLGRSHSAPSAIAGVPEPPDAEEMTKLADMVLAGMYSGDIDVAFDRAGAFCRVIARGQALWADKHDNRALIDDHTVRAENPRNRDRGNHTTRTENIDTTEDVTPTWDIPEDRSDDARRLTSRAAQLVTTAEELESSARAYRAGTLD